MQSFNKQIIAWGLLLSIGSFGSFESFDNFKNKFFENYQINDQTEQVEQNIENEIELSVNSDDISSSDAEASVTIVNQHHEQVVDQTITISHSNSSQTVSQPQSNPPLSPAQSLFQKIKSRFSF